MGPLSEKSDAQAALYKLHCETCLVAVMIWILRGQDFDLRHRIDFSDMLETVGDGPDFELELFFIGQVLELAAAAFGKRRAGGIDPVGGGFDAFHHASDAEPGRGLHDLGPNPVPGQSRRDEQRVALVPADAVTARTLRLDRQIQPVPRLDGNQVFRFAHGP